jgi:hypothetical protein
MKRRLVAFAASVAVTIAVVGLRAQSGTAGVCPNDSKLMNGGPTSIYGDGDGTWWGLVIDGLNAAGLTTDAQQIAYLQQALGAPDLNTLDELKAYNLQLVSDGYDKNQNGYVCAFELRGTRAYSGDPLIDITTFGISDDKVSKK